MNKKNIMNIIIISILLLSCIVYTITVMIYKKHFYQTKINSVVIKSDDWMVSSIKFIFADDNFVYLFAPWGNKMLIGDSVSKPAGSNIYSVYRRDKNGIYVFYKEYDDNKGN